MQSLFFLITTMFQRGINKKITFNKHFARKYIRAYTIWELYTWTVIHLFPKNMIQVQRDQMHRGSHTPRKGGVEKMVVSFHISLYGVFDKDVHSY